MPNINANKLKQMFIAGAEAVSAEYEYINELNVFPVPDGDTGTNMMLTINGAIESIQSVNYDDLYVLGKQFSRSLLMNARGNSGVIFSQIIKGFVSAFKEGYKEIDVADLVTAFTNAKNSAYMAVVNPVEGTILTVIRVTAEKLNESLSTFKNVEDVFTKACKEAQIILLKTPSLLRELKEVGVVDSGGYGLCRFLEGMLLALKNNTKIAHINKESLQKIEAKKSFIDKLNDPNVGFGYCCELIMSLKMRVSLKQHQKEEFDIEAYKKELAKIGDSMVVVKDGNIVKLHIHTIEPSNVLEISSQYGEFNKVKIENMTLQFLEKNPGTTLESLSEQERLRRKMPTQVKIIATVPSARMGKIYKDEFNISNIINTELTGNPSIQEFMDAIREANSANIIIVVDDSNIILAAKEAVALVSNNNNNNRIEIINVGNAMASYLSCLAFDSLNDISENMKNIKETIEHIVVAKISIASKAVNYSHLQLRKGDFIGIFDKKVVVSCPKMQQTLSKIGDLLIRHTKKPKNATIIYGRDAQLTDLKFIKKYLTEKYSLNVTTINGNQPTYSFYIAVQP